MLRGKITLIFAVTILVLSITEDNEVNAAPEPCREMMTYYNPFKKLEKSMKSKEDKEKAEKDKKKELLQTLEKLFAKMLGLE